MGLSKDEEVALQQKIPTFLKQPLLSGRFSSLSVRNEIRAATESQTIDEIIIPYIPSLKTLSLFLGVSAFSSVFDAPGESFRSIESVTLDLVGDRLRSIDWMLQRFGNTTTFQNATNLRKIDISGWRCSQEISRIILSLRMPWNQLTSIRIMQLGMTIRHLKSILRQCVPLQEISTSFRYSPGDSIIAKADEAADDQIDLPNLKFVELQGRQLPRTELVKHLQLPWEQLSTLELLHFEDPIAGLDVYQVLQRCARLERLSLMCPEKYFSNLPGGLLTLPRLKDLEIQTNGIFMLQKLKVPALTSLRIISHLSFPATHVSDMIVRSGCYLTSISQTGAFKCDDNMALRKLLPLLPSVSAFELESLLLDAWSFQTLGSGKVLPRLTGLGCGLERDLVPYFLDFLDARMQDTKKNPKKFASLFRAKGYMENVEDFSAIIDVAGGRLHRLSAEHGTHFFLYTKAESHGKKMGS
ncbi:hypothetical protein H0H81_006544 [Sphagnurus paluster]|uniref:Uncharacterized protein n=1 Tax=Sphagnurus paluster TaxID=117069 RepID=A0A9P7GG85_9AGAR|nr:hypothetical protein H0H81_006544 [Sphagnurus paluster]